MAKITNRDLITVPQTINNARTRPRKARRSSKASAIVLLVLLIGFAAGFAWNLVILPQTTKVRGAYRADRECSVGDAASGLDLTRRSDGLCRYRDVQVTFKWTVGGRYSTSYHVSLRGQDGTVYPNVTLNRAEFWKTTQVNQSLVAQILNGNVTMLRGTHATVITTDHPYSRFYLVLMRIVIFGGVTGLMLFLLRRWKTENLLS